MKCAFLFSEVRSLISKSDGKRYIKREQIFFKLDYNEGVPRTRVPKVKKVSLIPYSAVKEDRSKTTKIVKLKRNIIVTVSLKRYRKPIIKYHVARKCCKIEK